MRRKEDSKYTAPLLSHNQQRFSSPPGGYSLPVTNKKEAPRKPSPIKGVRGKNVGTIAPGQPNVAPRQKDKFVPLPFGNDGPMSSISQGMPGMSHEGVPQIFEDLPPDHRPVPYDDSRRGRITLYCLAESFDRKELDSLLRITYPAGSIRSYPDCYYIEYVKGQDKEPGSDLFFFDWGVVACWGMNKAQEMTVVRGLARQVQVDPLPDKEIEIDEFQYNFSDMAMPNVMNDTVTLNCRYAQDSELKLAISYALAQSTKLLVYEKRVVDVVLETKHLPESLAETGSVNFSSSEIAKLIGKVFLQKSAVNLLSSVLDTPEFFWHAPDMYTTLYNRLDEYLELPNRVELLNSRFSVLQEMLDMLRDHQNNYHAVRLELVVIWLIVVEVVVGLLELLGLFGIVGEKK